MILSRCPGCDTVFRVTPEQLKLRQGMVRCGRCGHAFNALDNLATAPPAVASQPAGAVLEVPLPTEPEAAPPPVEERRAALPPEPLPAPQPIAAAPAVALDFPSLLDPGEEMTAAADQTGHPTAEPEASTEPPAEIPKTPPPRTTAPEPLAAASAPEFTNESPSDGTPTPDSEPNVLEGAEAPPRRKLIALAAAVALLGVTASLQLLYLLRQEIVVSLPGSRPAMQGFCQTVGCDLELPRQADFVTIETSDLQPRDKHLVLGATIRNRADFAQQLPHLELTLTDARDRALARRVFAPADYLPSGADLAAGLAATTELQVHLVLDASAVGASGYRLYVFYP